jgi:hypothetical protein
MRLGHVRFYYKGVCVCARNIGNSIKTFASSSFRDKIKKNSFLKLIKNSKKWESFNLETAWFLNRSLRPNLTSYQYSQASTNKFEGFKNSTGIIELKFL